ncbi:MAG: hypothetical protein DBY23_05955 [Bacillota bacterium]|nr:MAG: hypothetical protein DBY23_05955 [Bacillota bacterium]
MKNIFDYINANSFLATLLGVIIGWLLNFISTLYFNSIEKKERRKEAMREEKKVATENKPVLCIERNSEKYNHIPIDIEIFVGSFSVTYDNNKDYKIIYSKNIKNNKNFDYMDYILKNTGKSDINYLDIVSNDKKSIILVKYDSLSYIVDNHFVNYNYCFDKMLQKNEKIKIRIYFEKDHLPYLPISATLSILFEDSNHHLWEQPFFYEQEKLYPPHSISYKYYRESTTTDIAYQCFEQPWLW